MKHFKILLIVCLETTLFRITVHRTTNIALDVRFIVYITITFRLYNHGTDLLERRWSSVDGSDNGVPFASIQVRLESDI